MNKNAIISFANSSGNYIKGLARLSESLRNNAEGIDFVSFIGEASLGCEPHKENPYSFKVAAFKKAREAGYRNILWLDASVFAIKPVQPIFDEIEENGFIFQEAGQILSHWANDTTLEHFKITRDEADEMIMIGNAGFLGLDFESEIGNKFFEMWEAACVADCFKGKWTNDEKTESKDPRCKGARHDMSSSSAVANILGIIDKAHKGNETLQYAGPYDEVIGINIIFKAQGL